MGNPALNEKPWQTAQAEQLLEGDFDVIETLDETVCETIDELGYTVLEFWAEVLETTVELGNTVLETRVPI